MLSLLLCIIYIRMIFFLLKNVASRLYFHVNLINHFVYLLWYGVCISSFSYYEMAEWEGSRKPDPEHKGWMTKVIKPGYFLKRALSIRYRISQYSASIIIYAVISNTKFCQWYAEHFQFCAWKILFTMVIPTFMPVIYIFDSFFMSKCSLCTMFVFSYTLIFSRFYQL